MRRERGSLLLVAAIGLMAFMVVLAVAIDTARLWRLQHLTQEVADAAALAGAQYIPDTALARVTAENYIKQRAAQYFGTVQEGASAYLQPEDIMVATHDTVTASLRRVDMGGTVTVIVRGAFNPIFMPNWLYGSYTSGLYRTATAVGGRHNERFAINLDIGDLPLGRFALFVGDDATFGNSPSTPAVETRCPRPPAPRRPRRPSRPQRSCRGPQTPRGSRPSAPPRLASPR